MIRKIYLSIYFVWVLGFLPVWGQATEEVTSSFGGQLVVGMLRDNDFRLNPFQIHTPAEKEIIQMIFGYGLTKKPDKVANPPTLINRYLASPDRKDPHVWRLLLNRNITFQNGQILRNIDVKFTIELVKKFGGFILNRQLNFDNIKRITLTGDLEISFELYKPDDEFGLKLSDVAIIPQSYYQEAMKSGYRVFNELPPMGMGPFRFIYQTDSSLLLQFHPHYYGGRPYLDQVKVIFFNDEQSLIDALVNGEIDYVELPDRNTARRIHDLMGSRLYVFLIPRSEQKVYTMLFNVHRFPFTEPEVRQAIFLALNRREIVQRFMKDMGRIANTLIPDNNPFYEKTLFSNEYNPQRALQKLKRAGWRLNQQSGMLEKNGRPLSFKLYFSRNSFLEEGVARTIKINLGELNINVEPIPVSITEKNVLLARTRYSAMIFPYVYDPQYLFQAFSNFYFRILGAGHNPRNYHNRYLSRLFNLTLSRPERHKSLYQRFQMFLNQDMPVIFLFFDERIIIGLDSRFHQFRTSFQDRSRHYYRMNPIENWFVPKEEQKY